MLRTRAPLSWKASSPIPSDLHVLGLPLAFILSQDQTLHCKMFCLFTDPIINNRICKIMCPVVFVVWIASRFYSDPFTVYLYTVSFSLLSNITVSTAMLHDYLYLIRTFAPFFSVRLYVLDGVNHLNFSMLILKIASSIFCFSASPVSGIFIPLFWDCKGRNLFLYSKLYFFYFLKFVFPLFLLSFLLRLRAAKMWFFYLTVKCYFTCFSVYFIHH